MLELNELNKCLEANAKALRLHDGNLASYQDLLIQRINILSMIVQVTNELNQVKKAA